jgi:hypothetical protein
MEDLVIPEFAYAGSSMLTPRSSALEPVPEDQGARVAGARLANLRSGNTNLAELKAVTSNEPYRTTPARNRRISSGAQPRLTLIVLRGGRMYLVSDYWVSNGKLDYTAGGTRYAVPLDVVDLSLTRQLNAERGIPFILDTVR